MAEGTFTNADKAKAARREAGLRRQVYGRWVENGRMKQAAADRGIAIMDAIATDYERLAEADRRAIAPCLL